IGRVVDCRGAGNLALTIRNTAISGVTTCLAYEAGAKVSSDHNCYHNAERGRIIEVSGGKARVVVPENLRGFAADTGVEAGSIAADPRFTNPAALDLSLAADSPARGAGQADLAATDAFQTPFGPTPNIGAIAASGDLRGRVAR